jgi:hypothetical protein
VLGKPRALCAGARVAIDGSQGTAVHAPERPCTAAQRKQLRPQNAPRGGGALQDLEGQENAEEAGPPGGAGAANGPATLAALPPRQRLSVGGQAQGEARGAPPRARTEPESRARPRGQGRGTAVGSQGQRAGARKPPRRMATAGTNAPGARDGLSPMALQAHAGLGCPGAAVAAGGSAHGEEGPPCLAAGMPPSVARPLPAAHQPLGRFSQADCPSEGAPDTDQGPAGAPRPFRLAAVAPGRPSRSEAPPAGGGGARQPPGTRRTGGRRLPRGGEAPRWEAREQRGRRWPEGMQQRPPWVAHPCGTRQRWGEAGSVLMRGREQVRTACRVTGRASTRRRVVHLVERPRRLAALGCEELGPRVVVRAGCLSARAGRMAMPASGGGKQSKTFSGGFGHSLAVC